MQGISTGPSRSPSGICARYGDRTRLDALLESHDKGKTDANLALWTLLAVEVWFQSVYSRPTATSAAPRREIVDPSLHETQRP